MEYSVSGKSTVGMGCTSCTIAAYGDGDPHEDVFNVLESRTKLLDPPPSTVYRIEEKNTSCFRVC